MTPLETSARDDPEALRGGVDEAGKGPVLGSMFAACVVAAPADLPDGVGDSKAIPPARREELATEIRERAQAVAISEITVDRIDEPATDMNTLTVAAHADALDSVARDGLAVYLDASDSNAGRFERRVAERVEAAVDCTAAHGADETHPIVGAASIVAKVAREAHVAGLASEYGAVGSGYPGDDRTRAFLERYVAQRGCLPDCARESWQTARDVRAAVEQAPLEAFGADGQHDDRDEG